MSFTVRISALFVCAAVLHAQVLPPDPVIQARSQRPAPQGSAEGDLPPVPRTVLEPPPLPPPEVSVKDLRKGRRGGKKSVSKKKSKRGHTKRAAPKVRKKP